MSYTTERQPQGILKDKLTFLREGLIAEIVAIDDYSKFIYYSNNKDVREILKHIMEEEKNHYGMFLNSLRTYDKEHQDYKMYANNHICISSKDVSKYSDFAWCRDKSCNLLTNIRECIKGELEAINLYEYFLENLEDEYLNNLISKIIQDEKEHVEELTLALTLLDKDKYGPI